MNDYKVFTRSHATKTVNGRQAPALTQPTFFCWASSYDEARAICQDRNEKLTSAQHRRGFKCEFTKA